jgi:hypothetical protein
MVVDLVLVVVKEHQVVQYKRTNLIWLESNGAELFIPNSTGQITQSARGTGGGATTVNFNINTVDASGFEELLIRSRGTITQLINNAVNERGRESLI